MHMEEPNIHRAEAQGRAHVAAARRRFGGLIVDTQPPGLTERTGDVEINELELAAYLYREAYESIRPLIEDQSLINVTTEADLCYDAKEGVKEGSTHYAWNAVQDVAALRALGLWEKLQGGTRHEIGQCFGNQTYINRLAKNVRDATNQVAVRNYYFAWDAARDIAALHTIGIWNMISRKTRTEIEGFLEDKRFIRNAAERVRFNAAKCAKKEDAVSAWDATLGAVTLRTLGLWEKIPRETRREIEGYFGSQTFISSMSAEVCFYARKVAKGGDFRGAWLAFRGAAALKFFSEHYEREAEEARVAQGLQGAAAARRPRSDKGLPNIPTIKAF